MPCIALVDSYVCLGCVCVCEWVGGGGGGGMGESDFSLGHLAMLYVRAMSCSRLEAHRLHLLSGFTS